MERGKIMKCPKCSGLFKSLYWREGSNGEFVKVGFMCKECKYHKLIQQPKQKNMKE